MVGKFWEAIFTYGNPTISVGNPNVINNFFAMFSVWRIITTYPLYDLIHLLNLLINQNSVNRKWPTAQSTSVWMTIQTKNFTSTLTIYCNSPKIFSQKSRPDFKILQLITTPISSSLGIFILQTMCFYIKMNKWKDTNFFLL